MTAEGDPRDGLDPGDVVVDEDLHAGIAQLAARQCTKGQDPHLSRKQQYTLFKKLKKEVSSSLKKWIN